MRRILAFLFGIACLALAGCHDAKPNDEAFGERVKAYLLSHPEVLEETAKRLEIKQADAELAFQRLGRTRLPTLRGAVEHDPDDFVANPGGKITVTEFYDYRCPHCINVAPRVLALIHDHPEVRVVFKEMPIFGPVSEHAARAALAVKAAHGDYLGFYRALMEARGLNDNLIDVLARQKGVIEIPAQNRHLATSAALFQQLGLGGTPAFIVGDQFIYGEDMEALEAAITHATSGGGHTTTLAP